MCHEIGLLDVANAGHRELNTEDSEVLAAPDDHGSEIDCATTAKRRRLLHNSAVPTDSADVPVGARSSKAPVTSPEVAGISSSTAVASSSAGECHDCTSANAIGPNETILKRLTGRLSQESLQLADLPPVDSDEWTIVLTELGFSALDRVRARK